MRNRFVQGLLGLLFICCLGALLVFALDVSIQKAAIGVALAAVAGAIGGLIIGYAVPPIWFFRYRFFVYGYAFAGFIITFMWWIISDTGEYFSYGTLVGWLLIGSLYGIYLKLKFTRMCRRTDFEKLEDEVVLQSDTAKYGEKGHMASGRIIQTNRRVFFKPKNSKVDDVVLFSASKDLPMNLVKILWTPHGIESEEGGNMLMVDFPKMWLRIIKG